LLTKQKATGATTATETTTNKELAVLLMKNQGIHEGHWILSAMLTFGAINIGQTADGSDALPAGFVALNGVRLERVPEPLPFSVNAAEVNPKKIIYPRNYSYLMWVASRTVL